MADGDDERGALIWACVHGHVFEAALPAPRVVVRCPEVSTDGPCLTSFVYEPFDTEQEARAAAGGRAVARPDFAPWAGPRRAVCDRLRYWSAGS